MYIFGSALRGELIANSDVDVLVVSDKATGPQRHRLAAAIEEELKTPLIFEIHLATREKLDWYRRHAKELAPAQQLATSGKASTGQPSPLKGRGAPPVKPAAKPDGCRSSSLTPAQLGAPLTHYRYARWLPKPWNPEGG
ncbi:MAG: nucleotidyltransferase domain-containing protein [Thermofilaceae archaeon]